MMPKIKKYVTETLGAEVLVRTTNQPQTAYAIAASLLEFELKKILIDKMEANKSINRTDTQKNLYNALVESYNSDKDIITSYGDVVLLKRGRDDQDKDEDPSDGSDRGTKRRKSGKDVESSKYLRSKEKKYSSTSKDASKSQHKSFGKSVHEEEPSHIVEESGMQQDQGFFMRDNDEQPIDKEVTKADWFKKPELPPTPDPDWSKRPFNLLKGTCKSITKLEYHLEECSKATTERLDWHNPKNKPYPFDLRKPFLLIQDHQGRQIIPKDYFINKDIKYLKSRDSSRRYSTSVTKTKSATYELKWIKDLVPKLLSPVVVNYDKHAYFGTSHWGLKRQSLYGYASNLISSKDVYSRRRIIIVTRLTIMKKYDYGHLEEIEVRRDDQQLYTFKEGDFKILRLQDIEDMLLFLV
nr:hypothetical protein [Tanacetum cinerariifolium]